MLPDTDPDYDTCSIGFQVDGGGARLGADPGEDLDFSRFGGKEGITNDQGETCSFKICKNIHFHSAAHVVAVGSIKPTGSNP